MAQTSAGYLVTQIPIAHLCGHCRLGAGLPQRPERLMRCVHPSELTAGQLVRGPVTCEGFEAQAALDPTALREPALVSTQV